MYIGRYRHTGFRSDGLPIFAELDPWACADLPAPNPWGGRQIDFTAAGLPRVAEPLACCQSVDDCEVEVGGDCFGGLGVDKHVTLYLYEIQNCLSARDKEAVLAYCGPTSGGSGDCTWDACGAAHTVTDCPAPTGGRWEGSVLLRAGLLHLEVSYQCTVVAGVATSTWLLRYWGCDEGCVSVAAACEDPIQANFGNITLNGCCECTDSAIAAEVNIVMRANCYPTVAARHVGFLADGTPLVATQNCGPDEPDNCCHPCCPLTAIVTPVSGDCGCMEVTSAGNCVEDGHWVWTQNLWPCGPTGTLEMLCTANGDGTSTLRLTGVCGVATTVTAPDLVVACADLEDLDVTFTATVTGLPPSCTGDCTWQWDTMVGWQLIGDTCTPDCDPCNPAPTSPPPSPAEGEQYSEPCLGGTPTECCLSGTLSIRIMR